MSYPIQFQTLTTPHLAPGGRSRDPMGQLLHVYQGSLLLRLGREQWLLPQGHSFWLPADCLHGLTLFQGCQLGRLRFSVRVRTSLPREAGLLEGSPLLVPLLQALLSSPVPHEWQGPHGRLLQVTADSLGQCSLRQLPPLGCLAPGLAESIAAIMGGAGQEQIAAAWQTASGLSPRSLPSRFREALGCGPHEWRQQWQVLQTLEGIRRGLSEAEAAQAAGLDNLQRFRRLTSRYLAPHRH